MTGRLWKSGDDAVVAGPYSQHSNTYFRYIDNDTTYVTAALMDPLITLTEDDARKIRDLIASRGFGPDITAYSAYNNLCDQLAGSSRMEEPTGFGAMVEAASGSQPRRKFLRIIAGSPDVGAWIDTRSVRGSTLPRVYQWDHLIDPRPVERPS